MPEEATQRIPWTRSARARRRAVWGGVVAIVGLVVVLLVVFVPGSDSPPETFSSEPANVFTPKPQTAVDPAARRIAGEFILSAVARQDLASSYDLAHPDLLGGLTRQQWETGNIPVVFYPADAIDFASFKVERSHEDEVVLKVFLVPKQGADTEPAVFTIGLKREGTGPWKVSYWAPNFRPVLPTPE